MYSYIDLEEHCAHVLHHVNGRMKSVIQLSVNVVGKGKYEIRKGFEKPAAESYIVYISATV